MAKKFVVCDSCAVALVNADTTHMDEDARESFEIFEESVGLVAHVGQMPDGTGCFDCPACGETDFGNGQIFEEIKPRRR